MQTIKARLQCMTSIIIEKKNLMYGVVGKGVSLIRTLNRFIIDYVRMIDNFVDLLQKQMQQKRINNQGEENQIEMLSLMRKKELSSIQEWRQMGHIINSRQKITINLENKKFQQMFQNLDADIQYYGKLRERIESMIRKNVKNNVSEARFWRDKKGNIQTEKYQHFCDQVGKKYREMGKIKTNFKNQYCQLSPHKYINLDYEKKKENARQQLEAEMNHAMKNKQYPQDRIKTTPKKQVLEKPTPEKTTKITKKYKYLFETQDDYTVPTVEKVRKGMKDKTHKYVEDDISPIFGKIIQRNQEGQNEQEEVKQKLEKQQCISRQNSEESILMIDDEFLDNSLQQNQNKLEKQLQYDTNVTSSIPQETNILQKILTDSLHSSKRWELEESVQNIRETAKFNYENIHVKEIDEISFGE